MAKLLKFEAVGYRDALGRYARRTEALHQGMRDLVREESRMLLEALRFYAPKDTGEFARGLGYRTDEREGSVTATFYVGGPHAFLLPIFIYGSRPHPIPKRAGSKVLRFYWERGPEGPGIYFYKSVQHPGTIPNPFIVMAMDSRTPHLEYNLKGMVRGITYLE